MINNLDSMIPKLNSIGVRVFKHEKGTDKKLKEHILSWLDDFSSKYEKYERK